MRLRISDVGGGNWGWQLGVVTEKLGVVRKFNVVRTFLTTLNF